MLQQLLWIFLIYGFLGWCMEVIYNTAKTGKFINPGFLSGPICPIYGFGALLVLQITEPFQDNVWLLFLVAIILTSGLELIAGFLMKLLFNQRWWDYRQYPFNIGGYICLYFSLIWGVACVLMVKVIQPIILKIIPSELNQFNMIILSLLSLALIIDFIATINQMFKLKKELILIDEIDRQILQLSDSLGEKISAASQKTINDLNELKTKHDEIFAKINQRYRRLLKAFPNSTTKDFLEKALKITSDKKK